MKTGKLVICFLFISSLAVGQKYESFGAKINSKGAVAVSELTSESDKIKIEGEVESVCKMKGCWVKLKLDNGETMRVTFKDYGFFVPKDIEGKKMVLQGESKVKETSVDELKHYAKDAGKSDAEIAKITSPKKELTFVATGVLVQK